MQEEIKEILKNNNSPILIACSGGADSICLLHLCIENNIYNKEIICIHFDHCWSQASKDAKDFVAKQCEKFKIKFFSEESPIKSKTSEDKARKLRYDFFLKATEKFNAELILTAHHLDDQIETFLFRLLRGSGSEGLLSIRKIKEFEYKEKKIKFIRPLLNFEKQEIINYCKKNHLNYFEDLSNYDTQIKRNLIRHQILPLFKEVNQEYKRNILNFIEILSAEQDYIREEAPLKKREHVVIQRLTLKNLLAGNNIPFNFALIEKLRKHINNHENIKINLKKDCYFICKEGEYNITYNEKLSNFIDRKALIKKEKIEINNKEDLEKLKIEVLDIQQKAKQNIRNKVILDLSKFKDKELFIKEYSSGLFFQPLNCPYKCKLKDFLINKKLKKKDVLLLMTQDNDILWIVNSEISDLVKITKDSFNQESFNFYRFETTETLF